MGEGGTSLRARRPSLAQILTPRVTAVMLEAYDAGWIFVSAADRPVLRALGVEIRGADVTIAVRDTRRRLGTVTIAARASGGVFYFDNADWSGALALALDVRGTDCLGLFHLRGNRAVRIGGLLYRGNRQTFFFGWDGSAVGMQITLQADDTIIAMGDDALVSSGVVIRNHDMHSVVDLSDNRVTNAAVNVAIERHVWIAQDVLLFSPERIGYGSMIGARSTVTQSIPPKVIAAGSPARVIRENHSWGRKESGITPEEEDLLLALDQIAPA